MRLFASPVTDGADHHGPAGDAQDGTAGAACSRRLRWVPGLLDAGRWSVARARRRVHALVVGGENPASGSHPREVGPDAVEQNERAAGSPEPDRWLQSRWRAADERDAVADRRERAADEREALADQRERAADEREVVADERERRLNALEKRLDEHAHEVGVTTATDVARTVDAIARSRALLAASVARLDRSEAQLGRERDRAQREEADVQREMAVTSPFVERSTLRTALGRQHEYIDGLRRRFLALSRDLAEAEEQIADTFEHLQASNPDVASRHETVVDVARDVARQVREVAAAVEHVSATERALDREHSPVPEEE